MQWIRNQRKRDKEKMIWDGEEPEEKATRGGESRLNQAILLFNESSHPFARARIEGL
jgi:hypothetical protein